MIRFNRTTLLVMLLSIGWSALANARGVTTEAAPVVQDTVSPMPADGWLEPQANEYAMVDHRLVFCPGVILRNPFKATLECHETTAVHQPDGTYNGGVIPWSTPQQYLDKQASANQRLRLVGVGVHWSRSGEGTPVLFYRVLPKP